MLVLREMEIMYWKKSKGQIWRRKEREKKWGRRRNEDSFLFVAIQKTG